MKEPKIMLATMLGALLAKHRLISKTVVTNPKDHPFQMTAILALAGDLIEFFEFEEGESTTQEVPK